MEIIYIIYEGAPRSSPRALVYTKGYSCKVSLQGSFELSLSLYIMYIFIYIYRYTIVMITKSSHFLIYEVNIRDVYSYIKIKWMYTKG